METAGASQDTQLIGPQVSSNILNFVWDYYCKAEVLALVSWPEQGWHLVGMEQDRVSVTELENQCRVGLEGQTKAQAEFEISHGQVKKKGKLV